MKPDFSTRPGTRQSGYALILLVLALMGIGGVVIAGFTQGVKQQSERERYLHNQRVLQEAKQALLQYAYNYPQMSPNQDQGPGRLPCPDMDNDGDSESSSNCIDGVSMVGRFPWKEEGMNFYDARDASGERLWFAVSKTFARGPGGLEINSDTDGGITVQDRSGALIHDSVSGSGVAAVIIAPGAPIARGGAVQDRTITNGDERFDTNPDTDPGIIDKTKYLDLFGAIDNADFINTNDNGFVTGPILDVVTGDLLVNDQMIVVTAAEVIAMAEQATLQAYRTAILEYLDKTGGVYPWLYNYDGIEYDKDLPEPVSVAIDKLSSFFPVGGCNDSLTYPPNPPSWHNEADCVANGGVWDAGFAAELEDYIGRDIAGNDDGIFGRIPSTFGEYFTPTNSQPIESLLAGTLTITFDGGLPTEVTSGGLANLVFNNGEYTINFSLLLSDLHFEDLGGTDGRLTATLPAPEIVSRVLYFWDDDDASTGIWTICGDGADQISDCHRDAAGIPDPGGTNANKEDILRVEFRMELPTGEIVFDADYSSAPAIAISAAGAAKHATIKGTFDASDMEFDFDPLLPSLAPPLVRPIITATYQYDNHYHKEGESELWSVDNFGDLAAADLLANATLALEMRYYPEIPMWASTNGWHNSIRMAYALAYKPPATGPCTIGANCLHLKDSPGEPRNVASLLVIAGTHDWKDEDGNGRLKNDVDTVFDAAPGGNHDDNPRFYRHSGNDKLLVVDEL